MVVPTPQNPNGFDNFRPSASASADRHVDVAAYALGALEPDDAESYEWHLVGCARCKNDLLDILRLLPHLDFLADGPSEPDSPQPHPGHGQALERFPDEPSAQ